MLTRRRQAASKSKIRHAQVRRPAELVHSRRVLENNGPARAERSRPRGRGLRGNASARLPQLNSRGPNKAERRSAEPVNRGASAVIRRLRRGPLKTGAHTGALAEA